MEATRIREYYQDHKRLILTLLIALAVVLTVGWVMKGRGEAPRFLTAKVQRGDITSVVQATGTINPLTTVPVGSSAGFANDPALEGSWSGHVDKDSEPTTYFHFLAQAHRYAAIAQVIAQ